MTNPVGRPTDYSPDLCEVVVTLGLEGKSRAQMAAHIGVTRSTIANWEKKFPEFLAAMERAGDYAMCWWEDQGQNGIWAGKAFNTPAWSRSMAARFPNDYRENTRMELTGADGGPVQMDDKASAARLAQILALAQTRKDDASDLVGDD